MVCAGIKSALDRNVTFCTESALDRCVTSFCTVFCFCSSHSLQNRGSVGLLGFLLWSGQTLLSSYDLPDCNPGVVYALSGGCFPNELGMWKETTTLRLV